MYMISIYHSYIIIFHPSWENLSLCPKLGPVSDIRSCVRHYVLCLTPNSVSWHYRICFQIKVRCQKVGSVSDFRFCVRHCVLCPKPCSVSNILLDPCPTLGSMSNIKLYVRLYVLCPSLVPCPLWGSVSNTMSDILSVSDIRVLVQH